MERGIVVAQGRHKLEAALSVSADEGEPRLSQRKRRAQAVGALKFHGMRASIWLIGQPCASRSSVSFSQA